MNLTLSQLLIIFITIVGAYRNPKSSAKPNLRVFKGKDDVDNEFPYVVSLREDKSLSRSCTGTLLAPTWVLTASHCLGPTTTFVRYGDMTIPRNETKSLRRILKQIKHPNYVFVMLGIDYYYLRNDIGLLIIEKLVMTTYGILSALDYKTLTGYRVQYAGFGLNYDPNEKLTSKEKKDAFDASERVPLQLGEGLVVPCSHNGVKWGPAVCVISKCTNREHVIKSGDSGGPLFHRGKVVGVASGVPAKNQGTFNPISPYINWLEEVMSSNHFENDVISNNH